MKKIFIDTNIFLDFYHYSNDDISKLQSLEFLSDDHEVSLLITDQIVNEYRRNRDGKIADALNTFRKSDISMSIPRLADQFEKKDELQKAIGKARELKKELLVEIDGNISANELSADKLFEKFTEKDLLFGSDVLETTQSDIKNAEIRMSIGNPPGKQGSMGDAINWEILLRVVANNEDIIIISGDSDFSSKLDATQLNAFLKKEWEEKKGSNILFYNSLSSFLLAEYKSVDLDEIRTEKLIRDLEGSTSFDRSRSVLAKLINIKEFTPAQINRIVDASITNDQIWNAHTYSPTLIGERLEQIVLNYLEDIENYSEFCKRFGIEEQLRDKDLPF